MKPLIAAMAFLCLFGSVADARPRQARVDSQTLFLCVSDGTYRQTCSDAPRRILSHPRAVAAYAGEGVIGHRPAGCPRRFCGCEASLYLFGRIDPYLNLAANWVRKFPRANPAPGMAAAKTGHVFVLVSHVEGADWLVHDGNSGGGLTRQHVRSINGYRIVDPNGNRVASR